MVHKYRDVCNRQCSKRVVVVNLSDKTAIVKFWAPWCQPCKVITPTVKSVAERSGIELIEINIDEDQQLAIDFGVRSIPMVVGIKNGVPVDQVVGAQTEARYMELAAKLQ